MMCLYMFQLKSVENSITANYENCYNLTIIGPYFGISHTQEISIAYLYIIINTSIIHLSSLF